MQALLTSLVTGGHPEPADLIHHACLTLSRNPDSSSWPFLVNGEMKRVDVKGPFSADSADMLLALAIAGTGIVRLSEHVVAHCTASGLKSENNSSMVEWKALRW